MGTEATQNAGSDAEALAKLAKSGELIAAEVGKIIVGQVDVIGQILTAFFARGHVVIEGVPGNSEVALEYTGEGFVPFLSIIAAVSSRTFPETIPENARRKFAASTWLGRLSSILSALIAACVDSNGC